MVFLEIKASGLASAAFGSGYKGLSWTCSRYRQAALSLEGTVVFGRIGKGWCLASSDCCLGNTPSAVRTRS